MFELSIVSIFRQSEHYLRRYFSQVEKAFAARGGTCRALWLEGDSTDNTAALLKAQKKKLESLQHVVTLLKFDTHGPYWSSINNLRRWRQLSTCWNLCLNELLPAKVTVCVESDLIWDPLIIEKLMLKLNHERAVIYPMLLTEKCNDQWFHDTWGFSRNAKKFINTPPFWPLDAKLFEDDQFLEVTTGGGMIVSTYEHQKRGRFEKNSCIMQFPPELRQFMDKTLRIYHPFFS